MELEKLPSFVSAVAVMNHKVKVAKWFCIGCSVLLAVSFYFQNRSISKLIQRLSEQDIVVVPGAPEFMRVRPGFIPDETVYMFSEYVASRMATFSYRSAEYQFKEVAEFMTPELKQRTLSELEKKYQMYRDLRVDEVFDIEPVRSFDLKNDARGAKYTVRVKGTARKYVEGNLRESTPGETIVIEFRTVALKTKQPWVFQIENITRLSPSEAEARPAQK